jgi:hypothetical protein
MLNVIGLGHSHIVAIAKGGYELVNEGAPFTARFVYLHDPEWLPTFAPTEGGRLNPRLAEMIERENPVFILLSIGGNEHNALSVARHDEPFDFILGEQPELPLALGAAALPEAVVREAFREKMEPTLTALRAFRAATNRPLVCLEPPPPLPNARILAYPKEFFKAAVDRRKISPEPFRYKMWRVQAGLYQEFCARHDVVYAPAPADMIDAAGLLAASAQGEDATHANAAYGRRAIEEMMRLMADRVPAGG